MMTVGAAGGDFFFMTADVTGEDEAISMYDHRKVTGGAKSLPAAFLANCKRGRPTTIMKNESLMFIFDIFFDFCQ